MREGLRPRPRPGRGSGHPGRGTRRSQGCRGLPRQR
ncbi:MAG: hypothetical protein M3Z84_07320 [Actinomycetota bacterium]|nr:hypothetical protein [Actinomycetota bacterium]